MGGVCSFCGRAHPKGKKQRERARTRGWESCGAVAMRRARERQLAAAPIIQKGRTPNEPSTRTIVLPNGDAVTVRCTHGRRRRPHGTFRGPGRGKKDYPEGKNAVRLAHGGSIPS